MSRRSSRLLVSLLGALMLASVNLSGVVAADSTSLVPSSKLDQRPWRGITLVTVADRVVCTGFVVGRRKVVTAAHCLTRDATNGNFKFRAGLPDSVRIHRGYSQVAGGPQFRTCRVSKVWAHPKFIKRNSSDRVFGSRGHDYAVLTTADGCSYPTNAILRLWPTVPFDGKLRVGQRSKLAGYPSDPRLSSMNGLNMWKTVGELQATGSDTRLINTSGFVAQGMSGGPVWRSFGQSSPCDRSQCVIAILTECEVNSRGLCKSGDSPRRAVRITPTVKKIIKRH
jgi:V8-like Glu-specific endopeptidase